MGVDHHSCIHLLEFKYGSIKLQIKNQKASSYQRSTKDRRHLTSFTTADAVLVSVELKVSGHICWWTFYKGFCAVLLYVE